VPARVTVTATDDEIRALATRILEGADYAAWRPGRWLRSWMQWFADLAEHSPVVYWTLVGGLAVVTLALSVQVFLAVRRTLREAGPRAPVAPPPPLASFAAEADALAGAGRFLEAAHRLQLAVIDLLLRGHVLELGRADANRTLRQRLHRAAIPAAERADLLRLIDRFERAWFRDRDDDPALYADWRTIHARLGVLVRPA
jgi:hypothetical protein